MIQESQREIILLALGGNLGDVSMRLDSFLQDISNHRELTLFWQSPEIETVPWGGRSQDKYINKIIAIHSFWSLEKVLFFCKLMEEKLGRKPRTRWQAREIDIDLVWSSHRKTFLGHLHVPHPSMNRSYLEPLLDLWNIFLDKNNNFHR